MSVARTSKRRATAAAMTLLEISAGASTQLEAPADLTGDQSLHRANSESENQPEVVPPPVESLPETIPVDAGTPDLDRKIDELLDQIGEGLRADDATNFEKLTIARKYGPLLWDLKSLAAHGEFMNKLKERFPTVNYAKCNRWMFIAKHEAEVVAALEQYPDVSWGPKKMIDLLKGSWTPAEQAEDDEDDCSGYIREDHVKVELLLPEEDGNAEDANEPDATSPFALGALNPDFAVEVEEHQKQESLEDEESAAAGPVTQAARTRPRPAQTVAVTRPAANRTEYEVEVRIRFKASIMEDVSAEDVTEAIRMAEHWTLGIETPFEYELSELGVVVGHVQPWTTPAPVVEE